MISLAGLALAPSKPKNVVILTKRLTNDTDLQWDANTDAESKWGKQHQSMEPLRPTSAAVCRSPISAYDEMGR